MTVDRRNNSEKDEEGKESGHPYDRFDAPKGITKNQPLKNLFGPRLVALIGESFAPHHDKFSQERFTERALEGIEGLTLSQRAQSIADALSKELPEDFSKAQPVLLNSLGPIGDQNEDGLSSLRGFYYWPHSLFVSTYGLQHFDLAMEANRAITLRFTAEFSVRPFLEPALGHQSRTLGLFDKWAVDSNKHVRRLVSEGTRPRLPWAPQLKCFMKDPTLVLPLLEKLKDDPELYVRRSVANHLGDILKDHPKVVHQICERWCREADGMAGDGAEERRKNRRWMVRHAVRLPAKKQDAKALSLRRKATDPKN